MSSETLEMEGVWGGAVAAWRLLAALEGAALALAAAAVLARAALRRLNTPHASAASSQPCNSVLISNNSHLGRAIRRKLESHGCSVRASTGATSGPEPADALVMVGSAEKASSLDALAITVSEDVSHNLKLLENLIPHVRCGGRVVWVSTTEAARGPFSDASEALSDVVRSQLTLVATRAGCEVVWLGRCEGAGGAERAAERVASALLPRLRHNFIRNAAVQAGTYMWRWLKIIS